MTPCSRTRHPAHFPCLIAPLVSAHSLCHAGQLSECESQLAAVLQQAEHAEAAADGLPTAELEHQVRCALNVPTCNAVWVCLIMPQGRRV